MKLLPITLVLFGLSLGLTACSSDDDASDVAITYEQLPAASRDFIETYFEGVQRVLVEKNTVPDADGTLYEVKLINGFELDFDSEGVWIEVDGNSNPVPDALIPETIRAYVLDHYPTELFVKSIEKKSYGLKIELSNGVELKFDAQGLFIGPDR